LNDFSTPENVAKRRKERPFFVTLARHRDRYQRREVPVAFIVSFPARRLLDEKTFVSTVDEIPPAGSAEGFRSLRPVQNFLPGAPGERRRRR
jgi:hypothetical protein